MKECDNKSHTHKPLVIHDDDSAMRVYCCQCGVQKVFRKDWRGVPDNKAYSEFFKRDILQGRDKLFYKYFPQYLKT